MLFNELQNMILNKNIRSLHDVSDGGLFTTLFEMAYSGMKGRVFMQMNETQLLNSIIGEVPGVVVEVSNNDWTDVVRPRLNTLNLPYKLVGWTKKELDLCFEIKIKNGDIKSLTIH